VAVPVSALDATTTATSLVITGSATEGRMSGVYSSASQYAYDGVSVWMPVANATGTAPEGQFGGRVTAGGYLGSSGALTISPGFTTSPRIFPAVEPNLLFLYGIDPWEWTDAINEVLSNLYLPRYLPLTLCADGDMEDSGVASWAAVGGATRAKLGSASGNTRPLLGRMLQVIATGAGQGVETTVAPVSPGDVLSVWAAVAGGPEITVAVRDGSGNTVASGTAPGSAEWVDVRFQASLPQSPGGVTVRITAGSSGTFFVGGAGVLSIYRSRYPLPSSIEDGSSVLGVSALPLGRGLGSGSQAWQGWSELLVPWPSSQPSGPADVRRDYGPGSTHWVEVGTRPTSLWPLFVRARLPQPRFSGPTAATGEAVNVPLELLVQGCAAAVAERLAEAQRNPDWARKAQAHRRTYLRMVSSYDLVPEATMRPVRRTPAL